MTKIIQTTIALTSKYNRAGYPKWLNTKTDEELDSYFKEHPASKYSPFNFSDEHEEDEEPESEKEKVEEEQEEEHKQEEKEEKEAEKEAEELEDQDKAEEDLEQHKLPLHRRLTFKGWVKSAPVKDVRKRISQYEDAMDDISLDRLDVMDEIKELKDAQSDDRETRSEVDSPRRKKRIGKRMAKRGEKIAALRHRAQKLSKRGVVMRKRIKQLKAEMKNRGTT